ncbi:hypothetical protein OH76DRAFT_1407731 [Lentinus brumalis]|uniref:HRDC domain-containing protein n=1 Tax=Lentinus brumalis TaxID=2498619 RepID=A0A371CZN4_9APHY|nr:hypothetical protein OH76DRAFT_1407731 [Polyporus brumalis]
MASSSSLSSASFDDYNAQLQGSALKATRAAVSLPADIPFHRSVHPDFAKEVDRCSARVLSLTNKLLHLSSTVNASASARAKGKARLEAQDDVVDNFHSLVVDAMDTLLERADIGLDEFLGNFKAPAIAVNPVPLATAQKKKSNVPQGRLDPALQHAAHLAKPQLSFKRKVDNSNHTAWVPTLRHKYNAQVPLGYNFMESEGEEASTSLHPYRYEIKHLSYPARMFTSSPPVPPKSFEETPFTWVSTPEDLATMLDKLRAAKEIAVDLEYHNYRSFGGFVCLMQISSREEDFVVDTLALRDELEELNEVFTNPNIVKVFHGAESDIVWLQQDFNLYVVNLFDTYHASRVLDFPRHGLATLLEMYCDFTADKRYQLADWRIRPLPEEMLQYARSDTHFLLFIYDNLRNALLDRAQSRAHSRAQSPSSSSSTPVPDPSIPPAHLLVREVLSRSEETALRVYEKERYDTEGAGPGGWDTLARKWNKSNLMASSNVHDAGSAASAQRAVYLAVHAWRDRVAREEDESTRYVLPNHYLFSLAERTPADMAALLSVFHPVPPVIRRRAKELLDAIRDAVKQALGAPGAASASVTDARVEEAPAAMAVDAPETVAEVVEVTPAQPSQSLWTTVSSITATKSVLFGASLRSNTANVLPIAQQSALLGAGSSKAQELARGLAINRARFLEAAIRIHSKLVIAPSVPSLIAQSTPDSAAQAAAAATGEDDPTVLKNEGHAEIPFIPASQRAAPVTVDDTIVVVGQSKKKKRKRVADKEKADTAAGTASPKEEGEMEAEAFDYTSVSNILDDGSDHEADLPNVKKRQKHAKGSNASFYGNFPAPPKAHSQLKSGNQSRTFR